MYMDLNTCPILTDPTLPRIAISAPVDPGITTFCMDACETVRLGTRMLWEHGVRRMGIIGLGWWDAQPDPRRIAAEAAPGMQIEESWRLFTNGLCIYALARNLTRLLLDGDPAQRPDGILVLDDHLTSQVGLGVLDAGRSDSVRIVSSCNFPPPEGMPVPVQWIGQNPRRILTMAMRDLAAARAGTALPRIRTLAPEPFAKDSVVQVA
jgi:DNA-binding LacI/PurR family transcriptional regulator